MRDKFSLAVLVLVLILFIVDLSFLPNSVTLILSSIHGLLNSLIGSMELPIPNEW